MNDTTLFNEIENDLNDTHPTTYANDEPQGEYVTDHSGQTFDETFVKFYVLKKHFFLLFAFLYRMSKTKLCICINLSTNKRKF